MDASIVWSEDASSGLSQTSSDQMASTIQRAFVTAYLLLGNFKEAEAATIRGIDRWDAASGKEGLFDRILTVAVEMVMALRGSASGEPFVDVESWLPLELASVLNLPQPLRSCYVLRILVGIPAESCGRVLALQPATVNQLAVSAMTALSSSQNRSDKTEGKARNMNHIDHRQVEELAYQLWEARGYPAGSPDEDWFRAEQELRQASHSTERSTFSSAMGPTEE